MKTTYIEHGKGYTRTHGFVSHDNLHPVPQERLEDVIFAETPFVPPERPAPKLVASK